MWQRRTAMTSIHFTMLSAAGYNDTWIRDPWQIIFHDEEILFPGRDEAKTPPQIVYF